MIYLVLLLAAALRLYHLGSLPLSLFGDEIDVGYHAWSLITTGRDYMGQFLPTYIHSLAEWRAPLLMYVTAPFVGLFGPTSFAVRLAPALFGLLSIYLLYLLANKLFPRLSPHLGLISAFTLTITPWHIHYSRAAFEVTLLLSLLLLGTYWFVSFLEKPKLPNLFFPIPFVLTFYTYSTANLFTPLLILSLLLIYRHKFNPFKFLLSHKIISILSILLLLPISYQLLFGPAAGRFQLISIFNDPKVAEDIVTNRTYPWLNPGTERFFFNKPFAYANLITTQYLTSLSPQFLFLSGDPNFRHSIARFGELPLLLAPFLILGLIALFKKLDSSSRLVLAWLLLAPLPSALTQGGATHATRLFILLPPLVILSALGLDYLYHQLKNILFRRLYFPTFVLLSLLGLIFYFHRYQDIYAYLSAVDYWHYGYAQVISPVRDQIDSADRVYVNNTYNPSLLQFAFNARISPQYFQANFITDVPQEDLVHDFNGFNLGKFYFGQIKPGVDLGNFLEPNQLYLAVQGYEIPGDWDWSQDPPEHIKTISTVHNIYSDPLFYFLTKD